jgi:hypothetical protein
VQGLAKYPLIYIRIVGSGGSIYIILNIRPNNILRTLHHSSTLMQQRTCRLAMREYGYAAHDGLNRICVDDAFLDTGDEKRRLAAFELFVEVNKECEQRGLASILGGGVVLVRICFRVDAGRWPCTV